MNPDLCSLLETTERIMAGGYGAPDEKPRRVFTGVDLGTAYTVLIVLDDKGIPIAGRYRFAQVVRDGLVVDFEGAVQLVRSLKEEVEETLGMELTAATSAFPPGVSRAEVRATGYVLEAAGMNCMGLVDEPSAANLVLQVENGAIVDVGGGTTGIAVVREGEVVYTADEPTGGTHFSLVIAGAKDIPFEEAEAIKKDARRQSELFPLVRPVMEKVASIVSQHVSAFHVPEIFLVGGTCAFPGMAGVIQNATGINTSLPASPLFITPLGIAMHHRSMEDG